MEEWQAFPPVRESLKKERDMTENNRLTAGIILYTRKRTISAVRFILKMAATSPPRNTNCWKRLACTKALACTHFACSTVTFSPVPLMKHVATCRTVRETSV